MNALIHSTPSMRAIALCLLTLTVALPAAPPEGAPELEKLRASYKAAVARGTTTILQGHIATLEKLRDIYARGANLQGATKVQADIDRAKVAMSTGEFIPPAADATDVKTPELDKLRVGHNADIERALKPYRETYVRELDKLRDNYTRAANLPAATAVQTEIDAAKQGGASGKLTAVGDDSLFVNKTWKSAAGTKYHFEKSGAGIRTYGATKTAFTWKKIENGVVEAAGPIVSGGPPVSLFFKFDNKKTALFGRSKEAIGDPLSAD